MGTCYALLVGINNPISLRALNGCEHDVERVATALKYYDAEVVTLVNENATKKAVVDSMRSHLSQAGKDDIVFFFYSGHGSQEPAPPIFQNQEGGDTLETIVCYDSRKGTYSSRDRWVGTDLCDKEMRYLFNEIWTKTNATIVAMFDSCHSGDNVRNDEEEVETVSKFAPDTTKKERKWKQFIFGDLKKPADADQGSLDELLPEAEMIQLSASRSDEKAQERTNLGYKLTWDKKTRNVEIKREAKAGGLFINEFLYKLVSANFRINYHDLWKMTKFRINSIGQSQVPQLYSTAKTQPVLFNHFLTTQVSQKGIYGNIQSNRDHNSAVYWVINLGAVHGIPPDGQAVKVQIYDSDDQPLGEEVSLAKVSAQSSILKVPDDFNGGNELIEAKPYLGRINKLTDQPTHFFFLDLKSDDQLYSSSSASKKKFMKEFDDMMPNHVVFDQNPKDCPYILVSRRKKKNLYLVKNHKLGQSIAKSKWRDFYKNPALFLSQSGVTGSNISKKAKAMLEQLEQVAHWEYMQTFKNPLSKLKKPPLQSKIYKVEEDRERKKLSGSNYVYELEAFKRYKNETKKYYGEYDVELKNTGKDKLLVAPLFLHIDFSVIAYGSSGTQMYEILPKETFTLTLGIHFDHPEHLSAWESEYRPAYLKLIVAKDNLNFDVLPLLRDPLPASPIIERLDLAALAPKKKKHVVDTTTSTDMFEWATHMVTLQLKNPFYT